LIAIIREFNVKASVGKPQVAYKEGITAAGRGESTYEKQIGGKTSSHMFRLRLNHSKEGMGFKFYQQAPKVVCRSHFWRLLKKVARTP
jgi:elongation factor G